MTLSPAVIGLAGHVDHGKTALIEAMTGMITARAHEQALGMTQDLGFAHFEADGRTVGVIDVPGHERYLRNMVAGVWCLDLLLLVVSASEGWMPMTTAHLQIAQAMGVERIVVCLTKTDLVTEDALAEMEENTLETVMDMTGRVPEICAVSALNGEGIDDLKKVISQQLQSVEPDEGASPLMCVDRGFVVNGIGSVVTGTLAKGQVSIGDNLWILPQNIPVKVRTLQAYHQDANAIHGCSRVAMGLKGASLKQLSRGQCLIQSAKPAQVVDEIMVRFTDHLLPNKADVIRKNRQVEVAMGTWHGLAQLIYVPNTTLARLKFSQSVYVQFGQPLAIIRQGGSDLLHSAQAVWCEGTRPYQKGPFYALLGQLPLVLSPSDRTQLNLDLCGYIAQSEAEICDGILIDDHYFVPAWLTDQQSRILALLTEEKTALSAGELASRLRLPESIILLILKSLKSQEKVHLHQAKWQLGEGQSEDDLPLEAQTLLALIREKGKSGLELTKESPVNATKWLRQLGHQKYITMLEGKIYYDMGLYLDMVHGILAGHVKGDRISMGEIKDKADLSRKYSIPLANRMEMDGWVRRDENDRIVLKVPELI